MSPRAACRLATLGFDQVYDYTPGKVDWLARGLPVDGDQESVRRVKDVVRNDAVRARLDEPVGQVRGRVEQSPYGFALVVAEDGTLLGRLRKHALEGDPETTSEQVMETRSVNCQARHRCPRACRAAAPEPPQNRRRHRP
jgi:hypothetical protein